MPHAPAPPSREQLLHWLTEAAELEHNLLCSYLFALFSLKTSDDPDLDAVELEAVNRWRTVLRSVCIEEMGHLAQVANLTLALGARPHFNRPNLPVAAGYHPADVVIHLTPLDLDTLDHLIFLERPEGSSGEDGRRFRAARREVPRQAPALGLCPASPDYATIGEFYTLLSQGLADLASELGEEQLFLGLSDHQLLAEEVGGGDLRVVRSLADARSAIEDIVLQGEGSPGESTESHHARFCAMKEEFARLQARRPGFHPARPVGCNPVMRTPVSADRTHVTGAVSAPLMDLANSLYGLMLRALTATCDTPRQAKAQRAALVDLTFRCMHAFSRAGRELTRWPASDADPAVLAGVSFAVPRATESLAPGVPPLRVLLERVVELRTAAGRLPVPEGTRAAIEDDLNGMAEALQSASA